MAVLYFKDEKIQENLNYISVEGETINNQEKSIEITEKGTYEVTYDEGYTGLEKVNIDVNIQGGGSGNGLDFSEIGYEKTPQEMKDAFDYAKQIYDSWDSSITSRYQAFNGDTKLVYFPAVDTSNVINMSQMFKGCVKLQLVPNLDASNVINMSHMFAKCNSLTSLDLNEWGISKVDDMRYMFDGCNVLTSLDLSSLDTSKVISMEGVFKDCSGLTSLDVSNFNTSNVTIMSNMFKGCSGLTSLDLSSFDTSKVTSMGSMFEGCSSLTSLDLSNFDTSKVTNMQSVFYMSKIIKIDGFIDIQKITGSISQYYFIGYLLNSSLRKLTFRNLGYNSNNTSCNFTYTTNWGVNSDEVQDARQSLVDSLITYSFDRATAGYSTCRITLQSNTKAVLTEEEIAQITSKGYTIA